MNRLQTPGLRILAWLLLLMLPAAAQETPAPDSGDTAWMLVAIVLVLLMTLPGLALFYGGLVRTKNVLSILVQCFAMAGVMSLVWIIFGASFATGSGDNLFIGDGSKVMLKHLTPDLLNGSIPESVWLSFQMTFIIITPALIVGAFAEGMKFSAMLIFTLIWTVLAYIPVWHMAWGGGLFHHWNVIDFAGGTVVHINAGVAGLVAITPAAGSTTVGGALAIGALSSFCCYFAATKLKHMFKVDDSLDVFAVHGAGGIIGAVLTGVFLREGALAEGMTVASQTFAQIKSVGVTIVWSAAAAVIGLTVAKLVVGLRVSEDEETGGLDRNSHGEEAYNTEG